MIFSISIVNIYLIHQGNYDTNRLTMLQFCESLVRFLLRSVPFENRKPGPRARSTSRMKRKLADHRFKEKKGFDRDVRKRCVD